MGDLTKNFSMTEIRCTSGDSRISMKLMNKLQKVRDAYGSALTITSGVRSREYNREVGGVDSSAHVPADLGDGEGVVGHAVDIACSASAHRFQLLPLLLANFRRVGIGANFIHVDNDTRKPQDLCFDYYKADHVA